MTDRAEWAWFPAATKPKTIMASPGPLTYQRVRYRNCAISASLVLIDESVKLDDVCLARPAAQLEWTVMGHCTAWESAEDFHAKMNGQVHPTPYQAHASIGV